ncbi:microtubule-associated protein 9 isoform X2 [Fundulus heteroclitus]|uniref:microtubule-associated protein 9 isoform X2 n=1 Tax=Fundulus heteroclitus TaxID=8078 RepID=UPI00165C4ED5|nr:microtubule-associated protein 9 isoform X2 [Fundulus heteroclitus]
MTDQEVRTLAYTKSPKTSKRTTFQDELQAAVSSRGSKAKAQEHAYYGDFNDEEDDFLNELLNSRKKRIDAFKAGRSKATFNTFELSDEEDQRSRPKKVSFLKSQRSSSNSKDTSASEPQESSNDGNVNNDELLPSQHPPNVSHENSQMNRSSEEPTNCPVTKQTSSLSYQTSDDALSLPLPSDASVVETPGPEGKTSSVVEETSQMPPVSPPHRDSTASADTIPEREPPRPKPRQRTLGLKSHLSQKTAEEESGSQDFSRPQTSSVSIPFSTDASSNIAWTDGDQTASCSPGKSCSNKSDQSQPATRSTFNSGSRDDFMSDDSKERGRDYSSSFEEFNGHPGDPSDSSSHAPEKSLDTKSSSSHSKPTERSQSACSRKVESKYLGTLKVLDRKLSLQETSPPAAETIRAAVYQEWLKKKREKSREDMQQKRKDELMEEKQKKSKKEDAVASYEAWKKKKAESLKAKAKERQNTTSKEQREIEEKEEKRRSAKQAFENWKREHDQLLRDRYRKQKQTENKQKLEKQEKEEEKQKESKSAFSDWCNRKKDVLHEKLRKERQEIQTKAEEEQYIKEEREKMALEMYENWLKRKDREQRRRKAERRVQAILQDSPPPPWSPPNKTVPSGK